MGKLEVTYFQQKGVVFDKCKGVKRTQLRWPSQTATKNDYSSSIDFPRLHLSKNYLRSANDFKEVLIADITIYAFKESLPNCSRQLLTLQWRIQGFVWAYSSWKEAGG